VSKPGQQQRRGPPATRLAPAVQGFPINHAVLQRAFRKVPATSPRQREPDHPGTPQRFQMEKEKEKEVPLKPASGLPAPRRPPPRRGHRGPGNWPGATDP